MSNFSHGKSLSLYAMRTRSNVPPPGFGFAGLAPIGLPSALPEKISSPFEFFTPPKNVSTVFICASVRQLSPDLPAVHFKVEKSTLQARGLFRNPSFSVSQVFVTRLFTSVAWAAVIF